MRLLLLASCVLAASSLYAQNDNWIAPEGKILNYRTLNWNDFQGKEDPELAQKLADQHMQAQAYVSPAIYFYADSGQTQANGRVTFKFRVKCAFQSRAFVRESTKQEHSNYVLIHEQDHYDIALTYANRLQAELTSHDYSESKYNEEIDKIGTDLLKRYDETQERYDNEVNPEGRDDKPKQYLWDMRIRKGMENNTEEYYSAPESAVISTKAISELVKRIPGEPALQFVVRARPLYMEFPQEMTPRIIETREWTPEPSIIAFYTQKYYVNEDGDLPKYNYRSFGYLFVPTGKDTYKRMLIDTFNNGGKPVKIENAFFVNADNDNDKELVVMATSQVKDATGNYTLYINKVYDNLPKPLTGRLKRLDDVSAKIEGGVEGTKDGATSKAKNKSEKEIREALVKMGFK